MRKTALFPFALLALVSHPICSAQEIQFTPITPPKGGWNTRIEDIVQDHKGFLWLPTLRGLFRYDGYTTVGYYHEAKNVNSLSHRWVNCVYPDKDGYLLAGTFGGGMDRIDLATGQFTHYRHSATDPTSISNDTVKAIVKDKAGFYWVGTHNGLNRFDPKTGQFTRYMNDPRDPGSLSDNQALHLYIDHDGTLWAGTKSPWVHDGGSRVGGLNRFDPKTGKFTHYRHEPGNPESLIDDHITAIFEDSRGIFWVGTAGDGLHTMDRKKGTFQRHLSSPTHPEKLSRPPVDKNHDPSVVPDYITFITEDAKGKIWIGTIGNGINVYDPKVQMVSHFGTTDKAASNHQLNEVVFSTAAASKEGSLWISSWDGNLYKVYAQGNALPHNPLGVRVTRFGEDNEKNLWFSSSQGLYRKAKDGTVKQFLLDKKKSSEKNFILDMLVDQKGKVWAGTEHGLYLFDPDSQTFSGYKHQVGNKNSLYCDTVLSLALGRNNQLFVGTFKGLDVLNVQSGVFRHYSHNPRDTTSIGSNTFGDEGVAAVWDILLPGSSNDVWLCVGGSVNRFEQQKGTFKRYTAGGHAMCITEGSDGRLWLGTNSGLYQYNKNSDDFMPYTEPLKTINRSTVILQITEDRQKNLWLKTRTGFIQLNVQKNEASLFENNGNSYSTRLEKTFVDRTGRILSGDTAGYFAFRPDSLLTAKPPRIVLTDFAVLDKPIFPEKGTLLTLPIDETGKIHLQHNQNIFSFGFTGIDFSGDGKSRHLLCMLENYETKWNKADEGTADYYNVPPGNYIFRVKAVSSNGVWAEKVIYIVVALPWWRQWWAYVIYGLLLAGGVFLVHRYQRRRLIQREQERARVKELAQAKEIEHAYRELKATQAQLIQKEKMASLGELTAGIAHEIQNPLNFVNNFSEANAELLTELKQEAKAGNTTVVISLADDLEQNQHKITHHGKRADSIVKGMLQHARVSTGEKELTDINHLTDEYLRLSYQGMRAKDKTLNAVIETHFDETAGPVNIAPQEVGRVLLNLFNNAFYAVNEKKKQGNGTFQPVVTVSTKRKGNNIVITVRDNGTGMTHKVAEKVFQPFFTTKPTGEGTGLGLSLSYDIITKGHGGELRVESKEGEGTEFTVRLNL
jgi:signal transduction histidine kinase/ligand-binding sensor domain-containing protein